MSDDKVKISRRTMVGGGTLLTAVASGGMTSARAQGSRKTFVLVHGAWHGGWCWARVADQLETEGHRVFMPTNTGLGERSHLLTRDINVSTHITDIVNVFKWNDLSEVVLVGHSYGGLVISGVADQIPEKLSSIIFLDAFLPENGDDLISKSMFRREITDMIGRGEVMLQAPSATSWGVTNPADRVWVDAKCTPQPIRTWTEKVRYTGGREKVAKRAYLRAVGNRSAFFDDALAKVRALGGWTTHEFACGHDVMVIQPDELTQTLLKVS